MSVYIKIKEAQISNYSLGGQISLKIKSKDTELVIAAIQLSNPTTWNCSFISSIKENKLEFKVILHSPPKQDLILVKQLSFSPLHFNAEKQTSHVLAFSDTVQVGLDIFYTKKKNFLGPIQFYEYENMATDSIILSSNEQPAILLRAARPQYQSSTQQLLHQSVAKQKKEPIKTGGLFFCCGEDVDQHKYEIEDVEERVKQKKVSLKSGGQFSKELRSGKPQPQVQFYQGACQSKNIFSICDAGVSDNKFTVVEDYYRDKLP